MKYQPTHTVLTVWVDHDKAMSREEVLEWLDARLGTPPSTELRIDTWQTGIHLEPLGSAKDG